MPGIQTSVGLQDNMTPVFRNMTKVMETIIGRFEQIEQASHGAVDTAELTDARNCIVQMNTTIDTMESNIVRAEEAQRDLNREIQESVNRERDVGEATGEAERRQREYNQQVEKGSNAVSELLSKVKGFANDYIGIEGMKKAASEIGDFVAAADVQIAAERKLETVMQERMGANSEMIDSVKSLLSAQQEIGVIGDEVAMAGAQQLATFLNSGESLKTLIPAMENLAAQQKDYNVTQSDMVNIGNLMGKAMQGQVRALSWVGITFDENQEKILKSNDEQAKAAVLAEILTQNVGEMNAALLATPGGQVANLKNAWGDMGEEIGFRLYPAVMGFFETVRSNLPQIKAMMMGLANGAKTIINVVSDVISVIGGVGKAVVNHWGSIKPMIMGVANAIGLVILTIGAYKTAAMAYGFVTSIIAAAKFTAAIATGLFTNTLSLQAAVTAIAEKAQWNLNMSMLACPVFWFAAIIIAIIGCFVAWQIKTNGLKVTLLKFWDVVATVFSSIKIAVVRAINTVLSAFDSFKVMIKAVEAFVVTFWTTLKVKTMEGVTFMLDYIGDLKVKGLQIIESFVNGSIDLINSFVTTLNNITGLSLDTVDHITIGTEAQIKEDAAKKARENALEKLKYGAEDTIEKANLELHQALENTINNVKERDLQIKMMEMDAANDKRKRQEKIEVAIDEHNKRQNSPDDFWKDKDMAGGMQNYEDMENLLGTEGATADYSGQTAEHTGEMANQITGWSDEDMKLLRESTTRTYMDKTISIKVDMTNNNSINSSLDIDGIMGQLVGQIEEQLPVLAEGVHI